MMEMAGNGSSCLKKEDLAVFMFCFMVGRGHRIALRNLRNVYTCISFYIWQHFPQSSVQFAFFIFFKSRGLILFLL